jgi:hypothetical protein
MLEEFPHLLPQDVQDYMLGSLYNSTIGDSYRVGGVDDDNLYPAYSNPSIMRAFVSGWIGRRTNDANMTAAGETYAKEVIDLFTRDDTLSEFNSGTYAGVSLFALTLWAKYMPGDSLMGTYGPEMIRATWSVLGELYNANLKNVAGPWDRAYGFDMKRYLSILALHMWTLVGKEKAPINAKVRRRIHSEIIHTAVSANERQSQPYAMGHKNDFAISPLIAILAPYHNTLVPNTTLSSLLGFRGTHTVHTSAFSPPYDTHPRNITAWLSPHLTIGAESFSENVVGGPSINPSSFNPAVVQWLRKDGSVGWLSLYAQTMALDVDVSEKVLQVRYPHGNATSSFSFLVGTSIWGGKRDVGSWEDVEGLRVNVSGSVETNYSVTFNGLHGGAGKVIK